jgi:hypothetical protein
LLQFNTLFSEEWGNNVKIQQEGGKDQEGSGLDLYKGTISAFVQKD